MELAFEDWVKSYYHPKGIHQICGDGSFVQASTNKIRKGKDPNIVNFVSAPSGLVLASELVMGKGGQETEGFKRILLRFDLKDALITADALNCTQWIMEYINQQGGYFLFPVKNDKKGLKKSIIDTLLKEFDSLDEYHQDLILDHGVLVDRWVYTSDKVDKLKRKKAYPYIKQFGYIQSTRFKFVYNSQGLREITDSSIKYYGIIQNFHCRAQKAAMIKTDEWKVETFHRYKDDFLKEDHTTFKSKSGIMVMGILRRVAFNYLILANNLISNLNKESLREKSIFFDANKDLLVMLVNGYNPDYPTLMAKYHIKKAQFYQELGHNKIKDFLPSLSIMHFTDLLDF